MTFRRVRLGLPGVILLALTSGCAGLDRPTSPATAGGSSPAELAQRIEARETVLRGISRFRVQGGLGIWNDTESHSARIDWRQSDEALEVVLAAPLGLGSATLVRANGEARLTRGSAPPWTDASAERLLQQALGLDAPVPLEQMTSWIRGLPGHAERVERDALGRLISLRWKNALGAVWQARVLRYAAVDNDGSVGSVHLPALMTAAGQGYRMRLTLRDWQTADVPGAQGMPDAAEPDARPRDAVEPDVREPEVKETDVQESDVQESDTQVLDPPAPDVQAPEVQAPDGSRAPARLSIPGR